MADEHKPKIMMVDDDEVFASLVAHKFQIDGIPFVLASGGAKALELLAGGERPEVILLDIAMPDMDGFEVLQKIKQDPAIANIPVIMLSNFAQAKDIEWGKKLGAAQFVDKVSVVPADIVDIALGVAKSKS